MTMGAWVCDKGADGDDDGDGGAVENDVTKGMVGLKSWGREKGKSLVGTSCGQELQNEMNDCCERKSDMRVSLFDGMDGICNDGAIKKDD